MPQFFYRLTLRPSDNVPKMNKLGCVLTELIQSKKEEIRKNLYIFRMCTSMGILPLPVR